MTSLESSKRLRFIDKNPLFPTHATLEKLKSGKMIRTRRLPKDANLSSIQQIQPTEFTSP